MDALKSILLDIIQRYGQKAVIILKTAINIAKSNRLKGLETPGDFDYKSLVEALAASGITYNPSLFLRALEREYNLIETSYKSSTQRWYVFKDLEAIEKVLNMIMGSEYLDEDPEIIVIKIQIKSIRPRFWLNKLRYLSVKDRLTKTDLKIFEDFAFRVLPKLIRILRKAEEYEEQLYAEINMMKEIICLAQSVSERLDIVINIPLDDENSINTINLKEASEKLHP